MIVWIYLCVGVYVVQLLRNYAFNLFDTFGQLQHKKKNLLLSLSLLHTRDALAPRCIICKCIFY